MSAAQTRGWVALSLNLAVFPGLGTLWLRRPVAGLLQLVLASAGAAGSIAWLFSFLRTWARLHTFPLDRGPLFPLGLGGSALFVVTWAWAGLSAARAVRGARTTDA